jgi:hypothetical protein
MACSAEGTRWDGARALQLTAAITHDLGAGGVSTMFAPADANGACAISRSSDGRSPRR